MSYVAVDLESHVPPYEQIRLEIAKSIEIGAIGPGERLASIRRLATELNVAAGTVGRAYRELEMAGLIEITRRGARARAMADPPTLRRRRALEAAASAFASEAVRIGAEPGEAVSAVQKALSRV